MLSLGLIGVLAMGAGAQDVGDAGAADWAKLQRLLRASTGVVQNPLPPGECRMLPSAPLLGNGEVGVAVSGDERQLSLFFGRADFRRRAIGGVDIIPDATGSAPCKVRHEQDIERAEVRSHVTLRGLPVEATSWVATDQALVFCELRNPSDKPLPVRIRTWTRPPMDMMRHPFRLLDADIYEVAGGLHDDQGRVAYGPAPVPDADLWQVVTVDNHPRVKNLASGRYLAITTEGKVETHAKADAATLWGHKNRFWHGMSHFSFNHWYLDMKRDEAGAPVPCARSGRNPPRYGIAVEYAAHRFFPDTAGHLDDVCWAWRQYDADGLSARAAIVTQVLGVKTQRDEATHRFVLPPGGKVTVAIAVTGDCNWPKQAKSLDACRSEGQALVNALTPPRVAELAAQRVAAWKAYWLKAWLDTGDPLLNRYWYGSLYLLNCTSREGRQSPALYGVWNTSDNPYCGNWEFNNYNYQSQMYGVFSSNRPELATSQFDDILKTLPAAQRAAANSGYAGAAWPRTIRGHANGPVPEEFPEPAVAGKKNRKRLGNDQLDAAAFLAMNFITAYETTLDRGFLEKKAYPMIRAGMAFYADYLVPIDGQYHLLASGAREGTPRDNNPAYPLAYIKRLATACADYSEILGVDADQRAKWRDIAANIRDYPTATVDGKTVFKEAENNPRISLLGPGDNVTVLQIAHPGNELGLDSDPKQLEIARNTLAWYNSDPDKTSWMQRDNNLPQIFTMAATIGWDAKDLYHWFHTYLTKEERPNLTWQAWGVEGAGATEAINRMMLQSQEGVLRFFPVWPKDKDAAFTTLRAYGAFLVSAELKNSTVSGVKILSEKGRDCTVQNPWPEKKVKVARNGQAAETVSGERFTLKTKAGETLELEPE